MKKLIAIILVMLTCLSLCACGDNEDNGTETEIKAVEITSILLSDNIVEIKIGETYELTYTILPQDAENNILTWTSANTAIATVTNGTIEGIASGQTTIAVSSENGIVATCTVTVKQKTAYERLSADEKKFVDKFLKVLSNFKNPDSVVVRGVMYVEAYDGYAIEVASQNSFGGTSVQVVILSGGLLYDGGNLSTISSRDYNVDLINQAIDEKR